MGSLGCRLTVLLAVLIPVMGRAAEFTDAKGFRFVYSNGWDLEPTGPDLTHFPPNRWIHGGILPAGGARIAVREQPSETCGGPSEEEAGFVSICRHVAGRFFSFTLERDPDDPKAPAYKRVLTSLADSLVVTGRAPTPNPPALARVAAPTPDPCEPYHQSQEELDNPDLAAYTPTPRCTSTPAAPRSRRHRLPVPG